MIVDLGYGYSRVYGEAGDDYRRYEIITSPLIYRLIRKVKIAEVYISPEDVVIVGGGFGGKQTFKRGTKDYDARVAQLNALEKRFFKNERWWKKLVAAHRVWVKKDRPPWRNARDFRFYESHSPMTWE